MMVRWGGKDQNPGCLEQRMILLEQNSFHLYEAHGLTESEKGLPSGHVAVWENRDKLAVAKLGQRLTSDMEDAEISDLLLYRGTHPQNDDYIEVAIYAEDGLDSRDINQILATNLKKIRKKEEYDDVQSMCRGLAINFPEV